MESSNNPSTEQTNSPATEAGSPATEAAAGSGPNLKGLPAISKAEVIRDPSGGPSGPAGRERRGPGGPGGPGGRGPRGPKGAPSGQEQAPDTMSTLKNMAPSGASANLEDATLAAEIEAMMNDVGNQEMPRSQSRKVVTPIGGARKPTMRGPRKIESAREHRTGTVISVGPTDIFVEFGPKALGVVPRAQYPDDQLPVKDTQIEVVVDKFEANENLFICSRPGQVVKADWEMLEPGQVVEARVTGHNKGGLELEVANHRAFMPASQVSLDRIPDLSVLVGEKFPAVVVRVDRSGLGNIVLSRRDLLAQERKEKAEKLKNTLAEGAVMDGTVRRILAFGAFIDIGGIDGLCHISDMTYDRVAPSERNVEKYVKVGEQVKVQILKLDLDNNKISLGMKQLAADPFATAVNEVREGADISGRVVRLADFGAFVELSPGVDGLVHVSEISRKRINKPGDVLKVDQVVTVRVMKIDNDNRKISLSMKVLAAEEPPAPGSREAFRAEKDAAKAKMAEERLKEIQKESPALRRQREQFRNKNLSGGFGKGMEFLGGGLGDLKL